MMRREAALFADSVSFSIPLPPGIPRVAQVNSARDMRTFFELLRTHVRPKEFELRQVIAEGDDVVFIGRVVCEVTKTGRDIDIAFALYITGPGWADRPLPPLRGQLYRCQGLLRQLAVRRAEAISSRGRDPAPAHPCRSMR